MTKKEKAFKKLGDAFNKLEEFRGLASFEDRPLPNIPTIKGIEEYTNHLLSLIGSELPKASVKQLEFLKSLLQKASLFGLTQYKETINIDQLNQYQTSQAISFFKEYIHCFDWQSHLTSEQEKEFKTSEEKLIKAHNN